MRKKRVIVWFRQDLRLHDNEALSDAISHSEEVIPVYVFDERTFGGRTMFGFRKTGPARARFIIDSVSCLRDGLRKLGSDLIVRIGRPEREIFEIANAAKTSWVFCNRERTQEEIDVQDALEKKLWSIGQEVRFSRGKMLYYTSDLPFPVTHAPDHFTTFRKETERLVRVREPLDAPSKMAPITYDIEPGRIPKVSDFYAEGVEDALDLPSGGEEVALRNLSRLVELSSDSTELQSTDNLHDQRHLSPWLSQGCLSPKRLYSALNLIGSGDRELADSILNGLLYRDYLRLMGKKHGNAIFQKGGTTGESTSVSENDLNLFWIWAKGKTGLPIIDAAMMQLMHTGYMSHKARLLSAYFLVRELGVAWRLGASYFESMLLDYDPCSNWVNWINIAGVGPDSKEERKINYVLQAKRLDPIGAYVKRWLPALRNADIQWLHQPDQADHDQLVASDIRLGSDYPQAVLSSDRWNLLTNGR